MATDVEVRKTNATGRRATVITDIPAKDGRPAILRETHYKWAKTTVTCECGHDVVLGDVYPGFAYIGDTLIDRISLCDNCGAKHFGPETIEIHD